MKIKINNTDNLWWDKRIFNIKYESLKNNKFVNGYLKEFNLLYDRYFKIRTNDNKTVSLLQDEYLYISNNYKLPFKNEYTDYDDIELKSEFILLRYNDLFTEYRTYLIEEMIYIAKKEKPEWLTMLRLLSKSNQK